MTIKRQRSFSSILCKFLHICDKLGFIEKIKETKYHTTAYFADGITFRQYHRKTV